MTDGGDLAGALPRPTPNTTPDPAGGATLTPYAPSVPSYIAFLRAINLGATRRFGAADIVAATQAAGGSEVATYLATGNVRLTSARRSTDAVARDLAKAYTADRGFEVATVVFTPTQVAQIVATADELVGEHGEPAQLNVSLYARPPAAAAIKAAHALELGDAVFVRERAAYVFLRGDFHTSTLLRAKAFTALGEGTARNIRVLRAVHARWG